MLRLIFIPFCSLNLVILAQFLPKDIGTGYHVSTPPHIIKPYRLENLQVFLSRSEECGFAVILRLFL